MSKIITASLPFIVVLLSVLAIITYVPWFSLALIK
jgi:TRAP-type C4-dicarboxylate transport system permease large subunit